MATRLIIPSPPALLFERDFDEAFEDILITRWCGPARTRSFANAMVAERDEKYQVKIAAHGADPSKMEVEVTEWRLTVWLPSERGKGETVFDFSHRIDVDRTNARFESGVLEITLPKTRDRKIRVQ